MPHFSLLVEGWTKYPHSYCLVNIFQILALIKKNVKIYIKEEPPYNESWPVIENLTDILLTAEENHIIQNLSIWNGKSHIDAIYRITYPYNASRPHKNIPTIVFYTAEFQLLKNEHFDRFGTLQNFVDRSISKCLAPVTPSKWSAKALLPHKFDPLVIPHGVDTSKFYPLEDSERRKFRENLAIPDTAFVFLNISAMTGNKNVKSIIKNFYRLTHLDDNIYLVLKGIGDLYACQKNINLVLKELVAEGIIQKKYWKKIKEKLVYINDLYGYKDLNALYNCTDCYLSPYIAEGFNMPVLEAISCGIPVIVSKGGSTDDFTNDSFAKYPATVQGTAQSGEQCLIVDDVSLQETMMDVVSSTEFRERARSVGPTFVKEKFTWDIVTEKLYNFIKFLIPDVHLSKTLA